MEVDWSFAQEDRWRRTRVQDRAAAYKGLAKSVVPCAAKELGAMLKRSGRAWQLFAETVGCVRVTPQIQGGLRCATLLPGVPGSLPSVFRARSKPRRAMPMPCS